MQIAIRFLIPLLIVAAGFFTMRWLNPAETGENAQDVKVVKRAFKMPAKVVKTLSIEQKDYQIQLPTRGLTYPLESTELSSENSGVIQTVLDRFNTGNFVRKGELLIQLDDTDYLLQLAEAEAQVAQAEAVLSQEEARSKQAELNWRDIGYTTPPGDLVLRKPQLKEASARLVASKASLEQAKRALARADIVAPYDGVIQERTVSIGTRLNAGQSIGVILSSEACLIKLPISANNLHLLNSPFKGAKVSFTNPLQPNDKWVGSLIAQETSVEEATKQPLFIARIEDPFSLSSEQPSLQIGQPLEAKVMGKTLPAVFTVPKTAMRAPNEFFFLTPESTLLKKTITPLWIDEEFVVFQDDFSEGTQLITSSLPNATAGMALEVEKSAEK